MAVMRRRVLLLACAVAGGASAQTAAPRGEEALRVLYGLAEIQQRAATLVLSRDPRPEVKAFATQMASWRETQVPRLREFLAQRGITSPQMTEDQRAVWDGLEPLDLLALTRRYAELQVQGLELEIAGYEGAARTGDEALAGLSQEMLPRLRSLLEEARRTHEAVKA
jgi:putative membrane protein